MCATKINENAGAIRSRRALHIETVDNWHDSWDAVLSMIQRSGNAHKLRIDADGWLSARQVLVVAFAGDEPAAHVCFSVSPSKQGCIEARLDSYGIEPRFCHRGIEAQLHQEMVQRAQLLRCEKLRGFRFNSKWC